MKEKENFSIVFMGTPVFAVTILKEIVEKGYNVKAVITTTDKPAGRGRKIQESDVKRYAVENQLPVLQPQSLKDEAFIKELKALNADLFVVVAFRMLPKTVWEIPKHGTVNLHGSLLPQYRGAAPINWAIINGESKTGVTSFFINERIDTGDLLLQKEMAIGENETVGEVHDRMMHLGAEVIVDTIELIRKGESRALPQDISNLNLKPAPKIFKEDCLIDFSQPPVRIHNFIRGLSPYPAAWIRIRKKGQEQIKMLKIYGSEVLDKTSNNKEIELHQSGQELHLKLKKGELNLLSLQLEGKKRMEAKQFLTGFTPEEWEIVV